MKNLADFRKTVETGVDPHLLGYVHNISDRFCSGTKTISDRASVHT